jgi:hypothetical protein
VETGCGVGIAPGGREGRVLAEDPGPAGGVAGDCFRLGGRSGELGRQSDILERDAGAMPLLADVVTDDVAPTGAMNCGMSVWRKRAGLWTEVYRRAKERREHLVPAVLPTDSVARDDLGDVAPRPGKHQSDQRRHVVGDRTGSGAEHGG